MSEDAGGIVNPEVIAICALAAVPGIGAKTLKDIRATFSSCEKAVEEGARAILEKVKLRSQDTRDYLARDPDLIELGRWAVGAAKEAGARICVLGDDDYPPMLGSIPSPPAVLYVKGFLARERRRIAVVGSRDPDEEAFQLAQEFGSGIARSGVEVVSGGARGIDTAAHDGAVQVHGSTVAAVGAGIDVVYPPENKALFTSIARLGAVISEFAPSTPPNPRNFPRRNRTVAGLSDAVVVVRAAASSGALITAEHAGKYRRPVFAVPGSAGCDRLIAEQKATGVVSFEEVLSELDWPLPAPARLDYAPRHHRLAPVLASDNALALWRLLDERTPSHVDELALRAQIPAQEALRRLAELELKGMCLQRPGKYFLRAKG